MIEEPENSTTRLTSGHILVLRLEWHNSIFTEPICKAKNPIQLGEWCTIKIERDRQNATMTINKSTKSQIIHGRIEGKLQGLDLTTPLYLGTVTQFAAFCGL